MDAWSKPGTPAAQAKPKDSVAAWHDLAAVAGDGVMAPWENVQKSCPTYLVENPAGLKSSIGIMRFEPGQAMMHRMEKADPRCSAYPFGDLVKSRGVTAMILVRPQIRDKEVRCLRLRNQDATAWLDIRAYPNNEWKLTIKAGPSTMDAKVIGRSVTQMSLVSVTWNVDSAKALLSVRGEDGDKGRTEVAVPKEMPGVLNEIRISDYTKDPSKPLSPTDVFAGDIAEIAVWPYAMEWEERSGQEWQFMQHLYKNPGNRY